MFKKPYRVCYSTLLLAVLLSATGCSDSDSAGNVTASAPEARPNSESSYNTALGIREFMSLIVDPAADVLWDSAGWINDINSGYQELYPTTDEGWEAARRQSAMLIEIGNMLALPGRAVDHDAWTTYASGISNAGLMGMNAAAEHNKEDFFQAGAQLYSACTACHQAYNPEITGVATN